MSRPRRALAACRELAEFLSCSSRPIALAAGLSALVNCLALTGSAYALQLYSVVLPARDAEALLILTLLMLGLYGLGALLDVRRSDQLGEAARRLDAAIAERAFRAHLARRLDPLKSERGRPAPLRDLDEVHSAIAGGALAAVFDLPFLPLYLGAAVLIHPAFGALAAGGAALLIATELANRRHLVATGTSAAARQSFAADGLRSAEPIAAMCAAAVAHRWSRLDADFRSDELRTGRATARTAAALKAIRSSVQSAVLGLGAYLAITGRASPGATLAASMVVARGLAPLEQLIVHRKRIVAAGDGALRLARLPRSTAEQQGTVDKQPIELAVEEVCVTPPGASTPALHKISFSLEPGAGLAVLGPSGAGKSALLRALAGIWAPTSGAVSYDRATQRKSVGTKPKIGYLPQEAELVSGTVADNICGFDPSASEEGIVAAAHAAGADRFIQRLPGRYQARVGTGGLQLSRGQRQRIAIARALYGNPALVLLDEPDAGLDADGVRCLNDAIDAVRRHGGIVIIAAHRSSMLHGLDQVMLLVSGRIAAFGSVGRTEAASTQPEPTDPATSAITASAMP
jgi:ATP-binding cassette subfamily C protein